LKYTGDGSDFHESAGYKGDEMAEIAVNVVLFTLVDEKNLRASGWSVDLLSPAVDPDTLGMSLWAVTRKGAPEAKRELPGSAVLPGERVQDAARRVVRDELGIDGKIMLRDVKFFDDPDRDQGAHVVSFLYYGFVAFEELRGILGGKDQVGLELVNSSQFIDEFKRGFGDGSLGEFDGVSRFGYRVVPGQTRGHDRFDTTRLHGGRLLALDHDDMVFYAWRKFRRLFQGRVDTFRMLGINPLGESFRLSELQEFADVARGVETQRDQFRREMLGDLENSYLSINSALDTSRRGKPAQTYTLKSWADPRASKLSAADED
jgi:ADP-ribose pyrophosphatase YjhB (NUDIX family)